MAELVEVTDIQTEQVKIGDVYELHFNILNIFQEIAGWFAPVTNEKLKQEKANTLIQKVLDESYNRKWFRILSSKVDGNTLILRIGISNIPQDTQVGQLGVLVLALLPFVAEIIVALGVAIGINVAITKAFKVIEKPLPALAIGAVALLGLFIYFGRKK